MIETVHERYGIRVEVIYPDGAELESMVANTAPTVLSETSLRMLCCNIRKVRPLERKLKTLKPGQSDCGVPERLARRGRKVDLDAAPVKISPLADWTPEQVDEYIRQNGVLRIRSTGRLHQHWVRPLHRASKPGRASVPALVVGTGCRQECGIHFTADAECSAPSTCCSKRFWEAGVHKGFVCGSPAVRRRQEHYL